MRSASLVGTPILYHFSCDHGAEGIRKSWIVRPNWHPLIGVALSWWTDMAEPDRDALGLTAETFVKCDRIKHRFIAQRGQDIEPWVGSWTQARTPPHVQMDMQRFGQPCRWWIALRSIRVEVEK